jgi:hypothetical protein
MINKTGEPVMDYLTDEQLTALMKFVGERMNPKQTFLEDMFNALVELQERRKQDKEPV